MNESQKLFAENLWDQLRLQACTTGLKARQIITLNKQDFLIALEKSLAEREIENHERYLFEN